MTGKIVRNETYIDYTEVARPLEVEQIREDVLVCQSGTFSHPAALVMWEQQWDWLVKSQGFERRADGKDTYQLVGKSEETTGNSLFCIPVRFA